ncbi:tRNA uridine 5-carboxymethylaminomethyl modification enzyme MnmG [Striga asiatica]|uniref:tRNA uridine 5-carboxymethylaminomethyl modification enzyme MnmG n=1 Tax=Striga asiatica TaxID=4170 RepID=A0A5A7QHG0_STRAF|nr:tRNA uridine 5-carboxymethylaminomethyl modification enzyme MnmG [Striga asiatica]
MSSYEPVAHGRATGCGNQRVATLGDHKSLKSDIFPMISHSSSAEIPKSIPTVDRKTKQDQKKRWENYQSNLNLTKKNRESRIEDTLKSTFVEPKTLEIEKTCPLKGMIVGLFLTRYGLGL